MYADNTFPEAPPRPAFSFYLAMTILIAGCLMAICYLSMLEAWYGEVGSSMERTIPTAWSNGFHVTLVSSRCPGESVEVETKHWQKLLGRSGIPFQTVQGVPQHFVSGSGVWVLPSARCLSDSARSAIRRWLL